MTSMKAEDIALRLWRLKEEEEEGIQGNRKQSDFSSTSSDMDDFEVFSHEENVDDVLEEKIESNESNASSEAKPTQSYIALIATAILKSSEKRLVLSDIYKYIMEKYTFFQSQDKSWRNSIRHNLSLNECFIKVGRSEQGKGHYWAIHPANYDDFSQGDFRRRRARRRVRRSFFDCLPYNTYTMRHPFSQQVYRPDQYNAMVPYEDRRPYYFKRYLPTEYNTNISEIPTKKYERIPELIKIKEKSVSNPPEKVIKKSSLFTIDNILNKQDKTHERKRDNDNIKKYQDNTCNCHLCGVKDTAMFPLYYGHWAKHAAVRRKGPYIC